MPDEGDDQLVGGVPLTMTNSLQSKTSEAETLIVNRDRAATTNAYSPARDRGRGQGRTIMVAIRPRSGFDDDIYVAPPTTGYGYSSAQASARNSTSGNRPLPLSPPTTSPSLSSSTSSSWLDMPRLYNARHPTKNSRTPSAIPSPANNNSQRNSIDEFPSSHQQQQQQQQATSTSPQLETRNIDSEEQARFITKKDSPNHTLIRWVIKTYNLDPTRGDTILLVHVRSSIGSAKTKWLDSSVVAAIRMYDTEERLKSIRFLTHYAKYVMNGLNYPNCRALTLFGDWKEELVSKGEMESVDALCLMAKEKTAFISKLGARLSIGARGVNHILHAASFPVCVVKAPRAEQS